MYSTRRALIGAALLTVALSGCSGSNTQEDPSASAAEDSQDADISPTISVTDAWIKAADEGMTGGFGTITNPGDDVMLTGVSTPAATTTELHETVTNADGTMTMQEKEGGFEIAEGGTLTLEPGGDHLMLIGLTEPLLPGDEVTFTFTFADGQTVEATADVKDYSGANESYDPESDE